MVPSSKISKAVEFKRRGGTQYVIDFPEIMKDWDFDKNIGLDAQRISTSYVDLIWWKCHDCGQLWHCSFAIRFKEKPSGKCPNCFPKDIPDDKKLSLHDPELCKYWSPKNKLGPEFYSYGSEYKVWWICETNPLHEFLGSIYDRVRKDSRRSKCPLCCGKVVNETNCVATLFPDQIKYWSPKNSLTPYECTPGMKTKVYWICENDPTHHYLIPIRKKLYRGDDCNIGNCKALRGRSSATEIRWLNSMGIPEEWRHHSVVIEGKRYYPDALDIVNKTWYEFNGDRWHGNPKVFDSNKVEPTSQLTFGQLYQKTLDKEEVVKKAGYQMIIMWEHDWLKINESLGRLKKDIFARMNSDMVINQT